MAYNLSGELFRRRFLLLSLFRLVLAPYSSPFHPFVFFWSWDVTAEQIDTHDMAGEWDEGEKVVEFYPGLLQLPNGEEPPSGDDEEQAPEPPGEGVLHEPVLDPPEVEAPDPAGSRWMPYSNPGLGWSTLGSRCPPGRTSLHR
jgi:hypothetical protein